MTDNTMEWSLVLVASAMAMMITLGCITAYYVVKAHRLRNAISPGKRSGKTE